MDPEIKMDENGELFDCLFSGVRSRQDGQGLLSVQGLAHERSKNHGRLRNRTGR